MRFHFDCIFYYVADLDRGIHFYRDVLGFKLLSRDLVARFDVDGVLFEIVPSPHRGKVAQNGNGRLCLRVENVAEGLRELSAKGVRVNPAEDKGTDVLGTFQDPDGNEICLWQEGKDVSGDS